jgi:AsmA-like C-terminal region
MERRTTGISAGPVMRRIIFWCAIVVLGVFCCGCVLAYVFAGRLRAIAFERTERYLESHLQSSVQVSDFHVSSLYPRVHVTLDRVVLRHQSRQDLPPLIQMSRVRFEANILSLMRPRPVVDSVELEGLQICVPPRRSGSAPLVEPSNGNLAAEYAVTIRAIRADDAVLRILPRDPARAPREFRLHHLELRSVDLDRPAMFRASLTNPVPTGEIETSGTFGPWNADNPAATPVVGDYVFRHADLGTLKGLRGILSSTGKFSGPLDYLEVSGSTDVGDFSLRTSERPVALHTDFSAIVDGTNGNTILKQVLARFLEARLDVNGEVADKTPKHGRTILLNAAAEQAPVEDFLVLAVDSHSPVMTGTARIRATVLVSEGSQDLIDRLALSGQFDISRAQFASDETERKIDALSLRGEGKPRELPTASPPTEFAGRFRMANGVVNFSKLNFDVPGASVALVGTYNLDSGQLDFRGKLRLAARLSETTTGVKSLLLKAVDPFFKGRNAGTVLPIRITGNKDKPSFGLDFRDKLDRE